MRTRVDAPRRRPVEWRRYSKEVHRAQGRLPRYEHPIALSAAASFVFAVAGLWLLQLVGGGIGAGIQQLGSSLVSTLPQSKESELVLGQTQFNVSAAPMLEGLPEFTKTDKVTIAGKVPGFAIGSGRSIELVLNGVTIGMFPIATDGKFGGMALTLPEGTSTISARLVEGTNEVASTSATVVVDRTAPALAITRPKAADSLDGPDVIVEGKTEPGADVSVNDRALRPNPDGTFTERMTAPVGPLTLSVVARDKAGNETKMSLAITVKAPSQGTTLGTTVAVTLDRAKVRPGEPVVAKVVATESGKPKADLAVTLQVGVITIGTYKTDAGGTASIGFAAPNHEVDDVAVVILGGGTSARATLTVATK
jgi:hypothetical protein